MSTEYMRYPDQEDFTLHIGEVRHLSVEEQEKYPGFTCVVTNYYYYSYDTFNIMISPGVLVRSSEPWEIFKEYLYRCHRFSSGQYCSRQEANEHLFQIIEQGYRRGFRRFISYLTLLVLNCEWLGYGVQEWYEYSSTPAFTFIY